MVQACASIKRLSDRKAARGRPSLSLLDVGGCGRITDAGVTQVLGSAAGLRTLDLRGLPLLTVKTHTRTHTNTHTHAGCEPATAAGAVGGA